MRFNLAHIIPDPRLHGLYGYLEVIETIRWGLTELGHQVTLRNNQATLDAVNILFGHQMLDESGMNAIPDDSIIYNLEQVADTSTASQNPAYPSAARRLRIWDYSERNVAWWKTLRPVHPPVHVPIGWSPTISRIAPREQDIDVLLYGSANVSRLACIGELANAGARVVYVCGLYGDARDELIARSRIVLNLNHKENARVFEIVRVSYLLANGKAVVSDIYPQSNVDPDLRDAIAFAPLANVPATCLNLLIDNARRQKLEQLGPEVMRRRNIKEILRKALAESGLQ